MAKLYFKYGAMGSSKTAQALITRFNYSEKGINAWLIKPSTDDRDGMDIIRSRIGLEARCSVIAPTIDIGKVFKEKEGVRVIIADECQFFTKEQILQLRNIVSDYNVPVLCFGLRTDFTGHLFPGSEALFALADSVSEIKSVCSCGNKAIINARIDNNGDVVTNGKQVEIGGNERYRSMCWTCWNNLRKGEN